MAGLPLSGVRVLDLTRLLPGPFATMLLADYGAEVVKIEDPQEGDYLREVPPKVEGRGAYFEALNRNKRSVTLDLKSLAGVGLFRKLVAGADVLIEGFRPGVMERLGLGWEALSQLNPRLVYCSVTGYGHTGPLRERSGHDLNYLALAGALSGMRSAPEDMPILPGLQVADVAGGMNAALAIVMAVFDRTRTGQGKFLDVAMLDGTLSWQVFGVAEALATRHPARPGQSLLTGATARYGVYRTADGRMMALAALEEKFWRAFCTAGGHPEWIAERSNAALRAALEAFFAERTRDQWVAFASEHDLCLEPVLEGAEALDQPQVRARGLVVEGVGPTAQFGVPFPYPGAPAGPRTPAPALGQDTDSVLASLGVSPQEVAALRERGVIGRICRPSAGS